MTGFVLQGHIYAPRPDTALVIQGLLRAMLLIRYPNILLTNKSVISSTVITDTVKGRL